MKLILFCTSIYLAMLTSTGCSFLVETERITNIYATLPLGSSLTKEVLKNSSQILIHKDELLVFSQIIGNWKNSNSHLLFYDQNLELQAAHYLPVRWIDSVKGKKVYAVLDDIDELNTFHSRRQDLPDGYSLHFNADPKVKLRRQRNTLIDSMKLQGTKAVLFVRSAEDRYEAVGIDLSDSTALKPFQTLDTLSYELADLVFFHYLQLVYRKDQYADRPNFRNDLTFAHQGVLDEFYDQLIDEYTGIKN